MYDSEGEREKKRVFGQEIEGARERENDVPN